MGVVTRHKHCLEVYLFGNEQQTSPWALSGCGNEIQTLPSALSGFGNDTHTHTHTTHTHTPHTHTPHTHTPHTHTHTHTLTPHHTHTHTHTHHTTHTSHTHCFKRYLVLLLRHLFTWSFFLLVTRSPHLVIYNLFNSSKTLGFKFQLLWKTKRFEV